MRRWPRWRAPQRGPRASAYAIYRALVAALLAAGLLFLVREGLLPQRWNPLPPLDLAEPNSWFLDWRLATLRIDGDACARLLRSPLIEATQVAD